MNKIKNASRRQNEVFKVRSKQEEINEKDKYAHLLEGLEQQNLGANT